MHKFSAGSVGGVQNRDYTHTAQGFVESITNHLDDSHLVSVTEGQDTFGYDTGTSRLNSISGPAPESLTYDANGNITAKGNLSFIYDDANRFIEVKDAGATVATYTYNGFGQQLKKVAAGETVIYHYDASGHLIAESDAAGQCWTHYIYLGDEIIAQVINDPANCSLENTYYVHNDHLGTPQKLTDATGSVVWFAVYTPYGKADVQVETVVNNVRFPGQYYDAETGLHYNYYRYYDSKTGRYLTPDPIGLDGGINVFVYVLNNPVNLIDPDGLNPKDKHYGLPKKFWIWYHRNVKEPGDPDLSKDDARKWHKEWEDQGKPGPDKKRRKNEERAEESVVLDWDLLQFKLIAHLIP